MSRSEQVMSTVDRPMYEWKTLAWRQLERIVFKLQKRIFRAQKRGDVKTVHRLQKLLLNSWAARCLAVRRVTQDNQGKRTAGVDGVKSLTPRQRMALVDTLKLDGSAEPVRRIWIDKPGQSEKRPLGIPTIRERARQSLVKQALEPEWEAQFEANSYGFRPGRSPHDAIEAIFNQIRFKPKWVLDADIAQCFDRIDHSALLEKIDTFPRLRRQVKAWLKASVWDNGDVFPGKQGTPQGSILSPLLANIALHGMEEAIKAFAESLPGSNGRGKSKNRAEMGLIRFADDLVVLHPQREVIERCRELLQQWLGTIGLKLKASKTRIAHTLDGGFDFLGFHIQQHRVGKHQSGRRTNGQRLGFKTITTPSKKTIKKHWRQLAEIIDRHKAAPQGALIRNLNPVIWGWSNYFKTKCSKRAFSRCDDLTWKKLWSWARRRHPNKSRGWIARRYWGLEGKRRWVFAKDGAELRRHDQTKITRHTKVAGDRSPYDGDLMYWSRRMGRHPLMPRRKATLLKRQRGRCKYCGLIFREGDLLEIDHIVARAEGGRDSYANWQLLHRHCHDRKHARRVQRV